MKVNKFGIISAFLGGLYLFICLFLWYSQDSLLFFPNSAGNILYEELSQTVSFENYKLQTKDGIILDGWGKISPNARKVVLYFGGNAEDITFFMRNISLPDVHIFSFNYRGYGRSGGKVSESALLSDALEIYNFLINSKGISPENLIIMGRSLGSGVANFLSSKYKVSSVILLTPYDSIESLAQSQYFFLPVKLLLKHKFPSIDWAKNNQNRVLMIYGGEDRVIPNIHTKRLYDAWRGQKDLIFIQNANHDTILEYSEVFDAMEYYLK